MSGNDRELRDLLETTQRQLRDAEQRVDALERARHLAERRTAELEAEAKGYREALARYEAAGEEPPAARLAALQEQLAALTRRLDGAEALPPRASKHGICARCGAEQLFVADFVGGVAEGGELRVGVNRDPKASLFKEKLDQRVFASVCGACGAIELTAQFAATLLEARRLALQRTR